MKTNEQLLMKRVQSLKRQRTTLRLRVRELEKIIEQAPRWISCGKPHNVEQFYKDDPWKNIW